MRFLFAALLAAVSVAAPAVHAQMAPACTHTGLYARLDLGGGYLHTNADVSGTSMSAYGGTPYANLALGGALAENLVVYGEIWGMAAPSPTVSSGGSSANVNNNDITLNYGGVGIGIGYFFMPANIFFAISLDATRVGISNWSNSSENTHSDIGGGATVTIGKQLWISDHWGIGLSIKGVGGGNRDTGNSTTLKTFGGLGALSLTFG